MYSFYQSWEHKHLLILAFGLVVLGIILEFQQSSTAGAIFEIVDSLANTTGVIIGYLVAYLLNTHKKRISSQDCPP